MTETCPPLAAFDETVVDAVADETGIRPTRLRELAARHQEEIRDLPGVDDIVYEWRNHFHMDPLVARTGAAYVLAVESHVWEEFDEGLDASGAERDALKALHDRQARALAPDGERFERGDAIVLTRP
jgi:hypothetical protein